MGGVLAHLAPLPNQTQVNKLKAKLRGVAVLGAWKKGRGAASSSSSSSLSFSSSSSSSSSLAGAGAGPATATARVVKASALGGRVAVAGTLGPQGHLVKGPSLAARRGASSSSSLSSSSSSSSSLVAALERNVARDEAAASGASETNIKHTHDDEVKSSQVYTPQYAKSTRQKSNAMTNKEDRDERLYKDNEKNDIIFVSL